MPSLDLSRVLSLQNQRLFTVDTPLSGRSQLFVNDFSCVEGLSQLYSLELGLISQDATIPLKQIIGQAVRVDLDRQDGTERHFHGYVTRFSHQGTDGGLARYAATVSPWLWMLRRRYDTRIFQNKNVEEILSEVFSRYAKIASYQFRLVRSLKSFSYCTQYRESDLNFVCRLLEQEGLHFFFEHEKDKHTLIVSDDSPSAKPVDGDVTLQFSTGEMLDETGVVTSWRAERLLESGTISLKTFDYKAPRSQGYVSIDTVTDQGDVERYEIYDYVGQYGFDSTNRGEELTKFRLEALEAAEKIFVGTGNGRTLAPGHFFKLSGHYDHDAGSDDDRQFLVLSVSHQGSNNYQSQDTDASYANRFVCIRKKIPFRAALVTAKPVIAGPQTAIVVGPAGEEIHTDELGRVKVQFHWDRLGQHDDASSCWVRVGQPWAGSGFGAIQIPRIGDEVIVSFLDGDPDRPIITSRVYNAQNMPPWALPANATQSGILTRSSKGASADNANAIRFEDRIGQEELWIHAEKDQRIEVENDESHTIGNDRDKSVGHDETGSIGRNWTLSTGGVKVETVGLASVQSVGLGKMLNVGLAYNVNVGGLYLRNVALQMASTVGLSRTDRIVQDWTAHVGHTYVVTVRGKAVGDAVGKDQATPLDASPDFSPQIPDPVQSPDSNQIRITDKGQASLSGSATAQLIGPGGTVTIDASGIHLKGKGIYLEGPVTQSGGGAKSLAPVTEADSAECAKKTTSAHPVDVATGQKLLAHDDFVLPGRIPIRWSRRYRSADQRVGSLGVAWKLQYGTEIRLRTTGDGAKLIYFDVDGRELQFPVLNAGQAHFHPIEKYALARLDDRAGAARYQVRFPNGIVESYAPHPADASRWQLERYETRDGRALAFAYTPTGSVLEIRNNVHAVICRHDALGRVTEVHWADEHGDAKRKLAAYRYDEHGDLIQAVDHAGQIWQYGYRHHLLTRYETPMGATFLSEWDGDTPQSRCIRTCAYTLDDAGSRQVTRDTRFDYQPSVRMTRVTDMSGNSTTYRYNGLWAVDEVTHPDGSTETTEFDETGNVIGMTDALGRSTRAVCDAQGNPVAIRDAAGNLTRIEYDERNLPVRITDPAGQIWQREYDADGHLVKEIDPLGNASGTLFENGFPVSETDALGNLTRTEWNEAGQLVARTDCSGFTTRFEHDEFGRITSQTNALGQTIRFHGDATGRVSSVEPAGLGVWRTEYDRAGRPVAYVDPLGRTTHVAWDAYGQSVGVVDAMGGRTSFQYDDLGRLARLENARGEVFSLVYDARGRVVEQTGFDGRRQQVVYNAAGERIEQIDHGHDGQLRTVVSYDNLGRAMEKRHADGTSTSFVYDERGLLTQMRHRPVTGEASQVTYEYDAAGRRTAEVQAHHGRVWRLQHRLDAAGNRSETSLPGVGSLAWQRYGSGHVHGVLLDGVPLASFERDALHRTTLSAQGSIAQLFDYTAAGQIKTQRLQDLDERGEPRTQARPWRGWQYDQGGQLVSLADAWRGERRYRYDLRSRLIGVDRTGGEAEIEVAGETLVYDPTGNLLARGSDDGIVEGMANVGSLAAGDRLTHFVDVDGARRSVFEFAYDGHGNRTSRTVHAIRETHDRPTRSALLTRLLARQDADPSREIETSAVRDACYRYDGVHQLAAIEHVDGGRTEYRYDAIGRRIAKIHTPAGAASRTTLFVWDGDWMLQEIHAGATPHADFPVTYIAHPDHFGPLAKLEGGRRYHYLSDHLGTPQELVDDQRKVVWAADFDAYGDARTHIVNDVDNPIRFPGQYRDLESGLYYNRHRYYDPETGRYLNADPIGLTGGGNAYAYVAGRPTRNIDVAGLQAVTWSGIGKAMTVEEIAGGGPEDPLADLAAGATLIGGAAVIGIGALISQMSGNQSQSQAQSGARQAEYEAYKKRCNEPPPSGLDKCAEACWKLKRNQDCRDMRQAWDDKWLPGRHAGDIANLDRGIKNLEDWIAKNCKGCT